ncbi:MAG: class I SAM-dependent rRNA methyltransferase [Alphaproteobacteria bacterium]|nr:class I SAM-dependent rRNA methyltransferase [Alphaproteobacteria bacterium]
MATDAAARPVLRLLPGRDARLKRGHPWVFSNEVAMDAAAKALPPGGAVTLQSAEGQALGVAMFNPRTLVAARLLDRDAKAPLDAAFIARRLKRALSLRERLFDAPYYRLVHAEADGLPGLVIDRFGDVVVAQLNTAGMEHLRPVLLQAIDQVLSPQAVVLRNDGAIRALEGLDQRVAVVKGAVEGPVKLVENGVAFFADLLGGQKTGWFYDQRGNRAFMAALARRGVGGQGASAPPARVIDLYSHTGGFAVQAACAGAGEVVAVDRSEPALALAERAAKENRVAQRCRFVRADIFAECERLADAGEHFDVVIADPPAFVKSKKDLAAGARGYRKLARMAARLTLPGGILFIASCSHNMETETFAEQVRRGLADAGRSGRILRAAGAAPDHPVHPYLPETAYLKSLVLAVD